VEIGTGFLIDSQGTFVTAYHVVRGADTVDVYDYRNRRYSDIDVIAVDPDSDVVVLTINSSVQTFLNMSSEVPRARTIYTSIGHPRGLKNQTIEARATQDGFADSLRLMSAQGRPVFSRSIQVIPLDLTVYNGMSGAPIINPQGSVVGVISGSFNVGGSLAWGIPAEYVISLLRSQTARVPVGRFSWPALRGYSAEWRGFSVPRALGAQETVQWIAERWQEAGAKEGEVGGFVARITSASVSVQSDGRQLVFRTEYTLAGDRLAATLTVDLVDALRAQAVARDPVFNAITVECPPDRNCVEFERQIWRAAGWRQLERTRSNRGTTWSWAMRDRTQAETVALAVNHLIHLNGGPISRDSPFRSPSRQ
jgi:hypothetical protein